MVTPGRQLGCIINSFDQSIEEFARGLRNFELDFRQLSNGEFKASTTIINLQDLSIARRTTTTKYSLTGALPAELIFYFPLDNLNIYVNGRIAGPDVQLISVGRRKVFSIVPGRYDHLLVSIRAKDLATYLDAAAVSQFIAMATTLDFCLVNPQRKLSLTRRLFEIYSNILYRKEVPSAQDCADLCRNIILLLQEYLLAHPDPVEKRPGSQEKLLQRVLTLIESNPTWGFNLDEMSKEVFASKRAIQYAFESLVGISPMRYIKLNRLNLVRKELNSHGDNPRLCNIVSKYSFSNAGRMVREYAELFGERPRETARRRTTGQAQA